MKGFFEGFKYWQLSFQQIFQPSERRFLYLFVPEVVLRFQDSLITPLCTKTKRPVSERWVSIVLCYFSVSGPTSMSNTSCPSTPAVLADTPAIRPTALTRWLSAPPRTKFQPNHNHGIRVSLILNQNISCIWVSNTNNSTHIYDTDKSASPYRNWYSLIFCL